MDFVAKAVPAPRRDDVPVAGAALPLGAAGQRPGSLRLGGTAVIMEHFDPAQFLDLVGRYRVTHSQIVPTMFSRLLKLPEDVRGRRRRCRRWRRSSTPPRRARCR